MKKVFLFLFLFFFIAAFFWYKSFCEKINNDAALRVSEKKIDKVNVSSIVQIAKGVELNDFEMKAGTSDKKFIVTRGMIEDFVNSRGRSAASLLTAGLTLGFEEFLHEAAQKYPDNPHVAMAILAQGDLPAESKAQWAESVLLNDPDNRAGYILLASLDISVGNTDDALKLLTQSIGATGYNNYYNDELVSLKDFVASAGGNDNDAVRILSESKKSADAPLRALSRIIVECPYAIVDRAFLGEDVNDYVTALLQIGDNLRDNSSISTVADQEMGVGLNIFLCKILIKAGLPINDSIAKTLDRSNKEQMELNSLNDKRALLLEKGTPEDLQRYYQQVSQVGEIEALRSIQGVY